MPNDGDTQRMGQTGVERAEALASKLGITVSELLRLLLQIPKDDMTAQSHMVLSRAAASRLHQGPSQQDYQRNQATHAASRIPYHLG